MFSTTLIPLLDQHLVRDVTSFSIGVIIPIENECGSHIRAVSLLIPHALSKAIAHLERYYTFLLAHRKQSPKGKSARSVEVTLIHR